MSKLLTNAVKNSSWTAVGSLMTALLGFLFAGLTIRWLWQAEAGFAIAIAAIIGINNTFSGLGLGSAATRLISKAYEENNIQEIKKIGGVCFTTSLIFGFFGLSIFTFGSETIVSWSKYEGDPNIGRWYCILLGLVFLIQQIISYFNIFLVSLQKYDWQTKLNTSFLLINGILGITFLKVFPNILTLGIIQLSLSCFNCLCTTVVVSKVLGFVTLPSWNQSMFLELWSFGKWIYLTQLMGNFMNGLDKIFLTSFFGSTALPLYTFPQRIYQVVHSILLGQSSYLFPMLSAQGNNLKEIAEQIEDRLRWFMGLLAGLIYAGLIIIGPAILSIMISSDFAQRSSFILLIFCWSGYIQANYIVSFQFTLSQGEAKKNWITSMINNIIPLGFLVIFSFLFGFNYANIGNLMVIVACFYNNRLYKQKLNLKKFVSWFFSPLYSSLLLMIVANITSIILTFFKVSLIVQFFSMIIFYLLAAILVFRLENTYFNDKNRLKTLKIAISIFLLKLGIFLPST